MKKKYHFNIKYHNNSIMDLDFLNELKKEIKKKDENKIRDIDKNTKKFSI